MATEAEGAAAEGGKAPAPAESGPKKAKEETPQESPQEDVGDAELDALIASILGDG